MSTEAFAHVAILGAAFLFGTKAYSTKLVLIVLLISSGVGLASYGETNFNLTGFILQVSLLRFDVHNSSSDSQRIGSSLPSSLRRLE